MTFMFGVLGILVPLEDGQKKYVQKEIAKSRHYFQSDDSIVLEGCDETPMLYDLTNQMIDEYENYNQNREENRNDG